MYEEQPTPTAADIAAIRDRKLRTANNDYRVAVEVMRILDELGPPANEKDAKTFKSSVYTPVKRRMEKAASALLFWQDEEQVNAWFKFRATGER